jgi:hypothetical protein
LFLQSRCGYVCGDQEMLAIGVAQHGEAPPKIVEVIDGMKIGIVFGNATIEAQQLLAS